MVEGREKEFITQRVNLPTGKSSSRISADIPPEIRAKAFFSARVAEAHILERFREISDRYSSGEISRGEAMNLLKEYAGSQGKDDGSKGLRNLASTARLNLILDQNAKMARAVGQYEAMHRPANLKMFPYVIYRASVGSKSPRDSHQKYDGMVIDKRDPWLRTHWPPWEFGCNCDLSNCSAKKATTLGPVKPLSKPEDVKIESDSGFAFDPATWFDTNDITNLKPESRARILQQAETAVKDQRLGTVGVIVAPAEKEPKPVPIPGIEQVKQGFEAMKDAAREELKSVGLDPDHLPDYKAVNQAFETAGIQGKNISSQVKDKFPSTPFQVATLNKRAAVATGLGEVPITLGAGNTRNGIEHLWRNHKEMFADPEQAIKVLQETLGNENCRVVVSLKRAVLSTGDRRHLQKTPICLKRIVLHNPATQSYCVMVWDGQALKLVSWNNAGDDYGNDEWSLK